jgi:ferredoxin
MNLIVNPIACSGHGVCAELLPELVELDEWGYPIIDPGEIPDALDRQARKAVSACPALALKLREVRARRDRDAARQG